MAVDAMTAWRKVAEADGHRPLAETPALMADHVSFAFECQAEEGWPLQVETTTVTLSSVVAA